MVAVSDGSAAIVSTIGRDTGPRQIGEKVLVESQLVAGPVPGDDPDLDLARRGARCSVPSPRWPAGWPHRRARSTTGRASLAGPVGHRRPLADQRRMALLGDAELIVAVPGARDRRARRRPGRCPRSTVLHSARIATSLVGSKLTISGLILRPWMPPLSLMVLTKRSMALVCSLYSTSPAKPRLLDSAVRFETGKTTSMVWAVTPGAARAGAVGCHHRGGGGTRLVLGRVARSGDGEHDAEDEQDRHGRPHDLNADGPPPESTPRVSESPTARAGHRPPPWVLAVRCRSGRLDSAAPNIGAGRGERRLLDQTSAVGQRRPCRNRITSAVTRLTARMLLAAMTEAGLAVAAEGRPKPERPISGGPRSRTRRLHWAGPDGRRSRRGTSWAWSPPSSGA